MSLFHSLRTMPLLLGCLCFSVQASTEKVEQEGKFLQSLEGIENQIYALPQSSLALIEALEEESLLQNQPTALLVRYWLAKATVLELLGRLEESQSVVRKGLELVRPQSHEYLLFKLIQMRTMVGKSDIDTALSALDSLLETSRENGDKQLESEILLLKGRYYDEQGEFKKSYAALMSSMDAAESSGVHGLVERAALELGDVLVKIQGYDRSEALLEQAYRYFRDRRMSFNELLSVLTIAKLHKAQFQYEEAIASYQRALKLAQIIGDGRFRFRVNLELAALYRETNQEKKMVNHLKLAENLQYRETSSAYLATFKLLQAEYMLEQQQFEILLAMIAPMLPEIIDSRYVKQQQMELLKVAAMAYAGSNDFKLAFETYGNYHDKFIQFSNQREVENLERQQTLFELERLEYENEDLNWNNVLQRMELENNRRTFYLLGEALLALIGVLFLMAVVFLVVNRSRLRMRRLAKTDTLTGLFNRRFLEDWFTMPVEVRRERKEKPVPQSKQEKIQHFVFEQVEQVKYGYLALNKWVDSKLDKQKMVPNKPQSGPVTLALIDVDYFKQVNDTYGHVFGDTVLTGVAKVLEETVRENDIVARFGGEEFVVVMPNTGHENALITAERLRSALSLHGFVTEQKEEVRVTCSFGVVTTEDNEMSFKSLCDQADKLLYQAKANGRNCVKGRSLA
ncbi:diguanylate cyclase [Vibrio alginolyticus]|nr:MULTISPECIES: tetratricopeptide repeat-containing diguanylate cyclase [Vibrio]EMC2458854.1 diguanylate cyclase [Vibrio alginolyticus]MCR9591588.1 diguanylate cyclase [Vibrio alginolyticus]MCS0300463.1 diguanylate cyclase [Vibrio alginolyticus]MDW1958924.1 tetratricopeptide repeat-containing diguanylate cyclase [Vibrio sp. 661]ULF98975.1 GGDEF domain-containing protein [Vibrio alginolyticus]